MQVGRSKTTTLIYILLNCDRLSNKRVKIIIGNFTSYPIFTQQAVGTLFRSLSKLHIT